MSRHSIRAPMLVLAAAALFSTGGAAIKATSLTGWQVASFRSAVAAISIALMLPGARRRPSLAMVAVAVAYATTLVLFVQATKETTSANAIFLQSTAPIYVLLVSPFLLREPIRRADVWFLVALALGLASVVSGHEEPRATAPHPLIGSLAAAASGLTWAVTVIGLRWLGTREGGDSATEPALVAGNVLAAACTLPMALPVAGVPAGDWLVILYLGVFQIGLAYVCLSKGMAGVPALEASLLLLLEPVLNPVWSWVVHGEAPGSRALIGGAIILVATAARTTWDATRN